MILASLKPKLFVFFFLNCVALLELPHFKKNVFPILKRYSESTG